MKVLLVEPEKEAYETEIGDRLKDMQNVVGGSIEAIYPYEEPVALICNEEGKLEGLPLNRALQDEDGTVYDIIAGTFFVCGLSEDNFASLSPELMEQFRRMFRPASVPEGEREDRCDKRLLIKCVKRLTKKKYYP